MVKPGDRVGAIVCATKETKTVEFAGYGIYKGDEIPPEGIEFMGQDLHKLERPNPRLDMDNGKTVWGCQVWWGTEIAVKKQIVRFEKSGYTVTDPKEEEKDSNRTIRKGMKVIYITSCENCPNVRKTAESAHSEKSAYCSLNGAQNQLDTNNYEIPPWCPLEELENLN